ncbi:putative as part of the replication protein A (RPA RP-A), a single-stranded DNA-binding heterotrimeric complex, may play an essential role in DNA replication, recombination and repair [Lyophyllum shimeji]|uniref:Replication protein A subunit n=1 Tax=Lyophyllum shimeji TaxID=47721 RepID=A0A9P3PM22_LYOSH|nr:putative as part of the replication protein A (RPA RP-A), a single-stranded DNA-binding heterotrimeric complex, may play an essential role in DNA replication, recombination and repair [Lyophyllum shimeji]
MIQLTAGSCYRLYNSSPDDESVFNGPHTVQFLSIQKVYAANQGGVDRYRIIMSDGINFLQAMLATQLHSMVNDQTIGKHTVAVIEKLTCNYVQNKRLIVILAIRVLETTAEKIGDPKPLTEAVEPPNRGVSTLAPAAAFAAASVSAPSTSKPSIQHPQTNSAASAPRAGRGPIFPIEGLSPYQNNWTIKARVTQKSEIKTWSNARGAGKLFNVTLMDETGEIRGIGFNLVVDELYPKLEEGKVYYISKARVNVAKKFSNPANDYELSFERNTEVEECHEATDLPMIKYHFVPLGSLEDLPKDSTCDVIAVVKDVAPLAEIMSKQQNKPIPKRELILVDQSGHSVRMTLWGKQAEQYSAEDSPVIAFKGVKVVDFGGRSLSMFSSSTMMINPDIEECFALRGWYDSIGAGQAFQAHSNTGRGTMSGFKRAEMRSIHEDTTADFRASSKNDTLNSDIPKLRATDDYDEVSVLTAASPLGNKVNRLIERLQVLFENKDEYKRLLACRESEAQRLLDMFQRLLDILKTAPSSSQLPSFYRNLIVATQRLAGKSGLFPACFWLAGVEAIGDHSESAGGFADIYKGIFRGRAVCLKTIRLDKKMQVEHFLKVCSKEAILWGQLSHLNLLPFFGMFRFKNRISLVAPWMEHGDMNEYLKNHPAANRVLLMLDVAEGLRVLHNNGIIHGDLKGSNILIMESGTACIADFGISSISDRDILAWTSHSSAASKGGSVRWQAPELFNPEDEEDIPNTVASDIYAWSCVVYEMFTGQVPFARVRNAAVMSKVSSGERPARPPVSSSSWSAWGLTEDIWTLMEDCWKDNPEERPTIDEIIDYLERIAPEDPRMIQGDSALTSAQFRELAREGSEHDDLSVETFESLL